MVDLIHVGLTNEGCNMNGKSGNTSLASGTTLTLKIWDRPKQAISFNGNGNAVRLFKNSTFFISESNNLAQKET